MIWPYNFLRDFFSPKKPPDWMDAEELRRSLEYVIDHSNLTEKERDLVLRHYQWGQTYHAIGIVYARCIENIRIPIRRAIVKMSENPRNQKILTYGITAYEASGDSTVYLQDLNLPKGINNTLYVAGYKTADQVANVKSRDALRTLNRIGEKSIDMTGLLQSQRVIEAYSAEKDFSNELAAVQKNDLWGFIDTTGKVVIPFKYSDVTSFNSEGLADVCLNGEWQIIDKSGELVYFK